MTQLVVIQLSLETVIVGKYHDLADSEVFQAILNYYLLSEHHIARYGLIQQHHTPLKP